jgi:hypothetical protein
MNSCPPIKYWFISGLLALIVGYTFTINFPAQTFVSAVKYQSISQQNKLSFELPCYPCTPAEFMRDTQPSAPGLTLKLTDPSLKNLLYTSYCLDYIIFLSGKKNSLFEISPHLHQSCPLYLLYRVLLN